MPTLTREEIAAVAGGAAASTSSRLGLKVPDPILDIFAPKSYWTVALTACCATIRRRPSDGSVSAVAEAASPGGFISSGPVNAQKDGELSGCRARAAGGAP